MRYLIAFALLMAGTSAEATVAYGVDMTAPEHHTATVTAEFPQTSGPYLDVMMPAWRTAGCARGRAVPPLRRSASRRPCAAVGPLGAVASR